MNQTLNDAQRKLVEDNHNLIYSYLKVHNLSMDAVEDWYGTAAIGLCQAALAFDEKRGTQFSTLAYACIDNEVKRVMRQSKKNIIAYVSLDDSINESGYSLSDVIPDNEDCYFPIYLNEAIDIANRSLTDKEKRIVELVINSGLSQRKVADMIGVSRETVSNAYSKYISKIKEYFTD